MKARRLSITSGAISMECLKPNPHAFTSGATVMSKAPSVSAEICCAKLNTWVKCSFSNVSSLWLMRVMMEFGLYGESELSTSINACLMSFCKSSAC